VRETRTVQVARGSAAGSVDVSMRVNPDHAEVLVHAGDTGDGAHRDAVVPTCVCLFVCVCVCVCAVPITRGKWPLLTDSATASDRILVTPPTQFCTRARDGGSRIPSYTLRSSKANCARTYRVLDTSKSFIGQGARCNKGQKVVSDDGKHAEG
jgi:hypothetical protein